MDIGDYFSSLSDDRKHQLIDSCNNATADHPRISQPGTYAMQVETFAYRNKKTNEIAFFPDIKLSKTGQLHLKLVLKTISACPNAPAGATALATIPLLPAKGTAEDHSKRLFGVSLPRLRALLGQKEIKPLDQCWIEQNLLPEYAVIDDKPILVKDHKMKMTVDVSFVNRIGNDGKTYLSVARIAPHVG